MKKAKIVIADNEDGKGWFIYRVFYVTEQNSYGKSEFVDDSEIVEGRGITIEENRE